MEGLKEIQPGIGFKDDNPFSSPSGKKYDADYVLKTNEKAADWYAKIIAAYSSGDFSKANKIASKPATVGSSDSPMPKADSVELVNP